jgi:hypothetical protein
MSENIGTVLELRQTADFRMVAGVCILLANSHIHIHRPHPSPILLVCYIAGLGLAASGISADNIVVVG